MINQLRHLCRSVHPDITNFENMTVWERLATRAIVLNGENILLLYTKRYNDYSLPGGGVDLNEDIIEGMKRELVEETGAQNIVDIKEFGIYEEYRPWYKPDFDIQHMISYCFTCKIDADLAETKLESYEVNNGMKPVWINIHKALEHNRNTITNCDKKGMSIERETFLLDLIIKEITNLEK